MFNDLVEVVQDHVIEIDANDPYITTSLVRQGLMPCAPSGPSIAVSVRTLEIFRIANLRSPHFTINSFAKTICDLHTVVCRHCHVLLSLLIQKSMQLPFKPYLSRQLSICFDLYLAIRRGVDKRVQEALQRNSADWRLRNCCPACTYQLEGEKKLTFNLLFMMDGNDSLKRIRGRGPALNPDKEGEPTPRPSNERCDSRTCGEEYFLERERVDALGHAAAMENEVI